tara:strand:- start:8608 stop:8814 length:207 start_codon:yes stop_codon:yes gene_type:complete
MKNVFDNIDYYKEVYRERVAIMMVDGGKTEKQAENDALHDTQELFRKDKGLTFSDSRIYTVVNKLQSR